MKRGDIITTKDGKELIAVSCADDYEPCFDCFFFKGDKGCVKKSEVENRNIVCWDKDGNHLIFVIKDDQVMKTINNLTVTVTYTVGIGNIKVPKEEYNDLIKHYDAGLREVPEDSIAAKWLANNIKEKDAMDWSYEIDDLN